MLANLRVLHSTLQSSPSCLLPFASCQPPSPKSAASFSCQARLPHYGVQPASCYPFKQPPQHRPFGTLLTFVRRIEDVLPVCTLLIPIFLIGALPTDFVLTCLLLSLHPVGVLPMGTSPSTPCQSTVSQSSSRQSSSRHPAS